MTDTFHWPAPDGDEIVLPHVDKLNGGLIRRYRKLDPIDLMFSIIEDTVDADTLAKIDKLDQGDLNRMFEDWQKAGAAVGKS